MNKVEVVVILGIIFLVLGIIFLGPAIHLSSTGTGTHSGYITAVEREGWFFPNYRIYVKTDNSSSQEDVYCLHREKEEIALKAMELNKRRDLVTVYFKGVRGIGYGLCRDIEITNIEVML